MVDKITTGFVSVSTTTSTIFIGVEKINGVINENFVSVFTDIMTRCFFKPKHFVG